jgi:hypothetical protein
MNAKQVIVAVSIALAGTAAMAQEVSVFATPASTADRAEVKAELSRAQAQGTIAVGELTPVAKAEPSVAQRDEVRAQARAEARAAVHSHELNRLYSL